MDLSIITINLNNRKGLEKTLLSIRNQTDKDFEYIVIDGASTDGSIDVIKDFDADGINSYHWVSESDQGIYCAMNKGIRMASGKYLLFINSGDTLSDNNTIEDIINYLHDDYDFILGRVRVVEENREMSISEQINTQCLSLFSMYLGGIPHQASFIRSSLFGDTLYDETLKISSDWKFFVERIVFNNASMLSIPNVVANYDNSGVSSVNIDMLWAERKHILSEMLPPNIFRDYMAIFPHYYEVTRIQWLLKHPLFYKVYRGWASLGMRLFK